MSRESLFFVYGLLMSDGPGFKALNMDGRARVVRPERIRGLLVNLGEYPGLVRSDTAVVDGELISVADPALIDELDAYELYDPANPTGSEYLRVEIETLDTGARAWTYAYNRPIDGLPLIVSGDWRQR